MPSRPRSRRRITAIRLRHCLFLVGLLGCTTQDMGALTGAARFSDYPSQLFAAFELACSSPAQTYRRHADDHVECREYLPPTETAAIILNYDGTPQDLPQLVFGFRTSRDTEGYLVRNEVYLNVPQKQGPALRVNQRDPRFDRMLADLYRRSGGVPE